MHPTAGYHEWIRHQAPAERWECRIQLAAHAYAEAIGRPVAMGAPATLDAADRLRETVDQAAHHLATGRPAPAAVDRLRADAVQLGLALVTLGRCMRRQDGVPAAADRYGATLAAVHTGLQQLAT